MCQPKFSFNSLWSMNEWIKTGLEYRYWNLRRKNKSFISNSDPFSLPNFKRSFSCKNIYWQFQIRFLHKIGISKDFNVIVIVLVWLTFLYHFTLYSTREGEMIKEIKQALWQYKRLTKLLFHTDKSWLENKRRQSLGCT